MPLYKFTVLFTDGHTETLRYVCDSYLEAEAQRGEIERHHNGVKSVTTAIDRSDAELYRAVVNGWLSLFYDDMFLCAVEDRHECTPGITTVDYFRREIRNGKPVA